MPGLLPAAFAMAFAAAQPTAVTVSIDAGATRQVIARFDRGQWLTTADGGCLAPATGSERVSATGAAAVTVERVTEDDARRTAVRAAVTRVFEQRQREHRLTLPSAEEVPVTLDWLYAVGDDAGSTVYYFESSRRVPDPGTAPDDDPRGTL